MSRVEVLSGLERRRRWSAEQKRSIVAEAFARGASVCAVARRLDLVPGQIYRGRDELLDPALDVLVFTQPPCAHAGEFGDSDRFLHCCNNTTRPACKWPTST